MFKLDSTAIGEKEQWFNKNLDGQNYFARVFNNQ